MDELLRRLSLDVTSLADRLRALFYELPLPRRMTTATIVAGATTSTISHGLGRLPLAVVAVPSSPATLGVVWTASTVTVTASAAPVADLSLTLVIL